jgi:REP element-mobilizing transposase RayT
MYAFVSARLFARHAKGIQAMSNDLSSDYVHLFVEIPISISVSDFVWRVDLAHNLLLVLIFKIQGVYKSKGYSVPD